MDDKANDAPVTKAEATSEPHDIAAIIDAWHREFFTGCATTEAWNHSVKAKEELKKLLTKI